VILGHSTQVLDVPPWLLTVGAPLFDGALGVQVFFVLSGWLICSLLLREREKKGRISLRDFYVRRSLRIWPAFYVFLLTVAVLAAVGAIDVPLQDFVWAGLFLGNYAPQPLDWWLGHTWSLAVEEQFYLLWPLIIVRCSPRTALKICVAAIAVAPVIRVAGYVLVPERREQGDMFLHARMDALLFGCALALLPVAAPAAHRWLIGLVRRPWAVPAALGTIYLCSVLATCWAAGSCSPPATRWRAWLWCCCCATCPRTRRGAWTGR
jgi:peptidoglycan/LPS O-acetylase OafA/YrhL